jgi:hypothetical protein
LEHHPIQSLYLFNHLPLFGAIFYLWLLVLLLLLFSRQNSKGHGEGLALVLIFSLVFVGYWIVIRPGPEAFPGKAGDGIVSGATVRYILDHGVIEAPVPVHLSLGFPGLHLVTGSLSLVTGLSIFDSVYIILLFFLIALVSLLYWLSSTGLRNDYLVVPLAVLLMLVANPLTRWLLQFHPTHFALVFLVLLIALLYKTQRPSLTMLMVLILALLAATVTHPVASWTFFFIGLGLFLLQRQADRTWIRLTTLALLAVIPIAWLLYWAEGSFEGIVRMLPKLMEDITDPLGYLTIIMQAHVGGVTPLWASAVQFFWLALVFGLGTLLAVWNLSRFRHLTPLQKVETGGLAGIALLTFLIIIVSLKGTEYYRYLQYGGFFAVPIVLRFFMSLNYPLRHLALVFLIVAVFVLSFPTFLVHGRYCATASYYPSDTAAGQFLEMNYDRGEGLTVYSSHGEALGYYYLPEASFVPEGEAWHVANPAGLWRAMDRQLTSFDRNGGLEEKRVFIFTKRQRATWEALLGVPADAPGWTVVEKRLNEQRRIYDNGSIVMYTPLSK